MLLTWLTSPGRHRWSSRWRRLRRTRATRLLRWLAAVYRCAHIQAVGTGDDVEAAANEALARGEEANEPDTFLWYAPQLLTARMMQGRVAEVMEVVRQGAANPGLPIWRPVFARMLLYVGEVDEATEVMGAAARRGRSRSLRRDVVARPHVLGRGRVHASGHPNRRPSSIDAWRPSRDGWPASARPSTTPPRWSSRRWQHERVNPTWPPSISPPPTTSTCRMNSPFWVAETELAWGRFLLDSGDTGRGRELLRSATERAEEHGFGAIVEGGRCALLPE